MNRLHFSENMVRLRREKGVTQEAVAQFIGVTKASISKWETAQSLPDVLLLPELACYFDVTVDELLGYEPWLSREQIKAYYHTLAEEFVKEPFETVMEKSRRLVKRYYSCYPFLLQIAVLWINHFMLAGETERQMEILRDAGELCDRILKCCKDLAASAMALNLKAFVDLQMRKPEKVVEALEEVQRTEELTNHAELLIQAYLMLGHTEKADQSAQVEAYRHTLSLLESIGELLSIHGGDRTYCKELLRRGDGLIELFDLQNLHPNAAAGFYYQAALILAGYGEEEEAYLRLECFAKLANKLLNEKELLHGDPFFNRLDAWIEELDLGSQKVRAEELIRKSAVEALEHPAFSGLKDQKRLAHVKLMVTG